MFSQNIKARDLETEITRLIFRRKNDREFFERRGFFWLYSKITTSFISSSFNSEFVRKFRKTVIRLYIFNTVVVIRGGVYGCCI